VSPVRLEVRLFGGFELRVGERAVMLPTRQCRLLLAYIFAHDPRPHRRALLAGLFWPDCTERRALRNLSDALWRCAAALRACGYTPEPWDKIGDAVRLVDDGRWWCDAREFHQMLRTLTDGDTCLSTAELYRGEFMEGFYHEWCLQERDWFRDRYVDVLRRGVGLHMENGALEEALALARRWCATAPWAEEAHRHLMMLYSRLGRPDECMAQYVRCVETLAQEFGAEPSAETKGLYRSLLTASTREPRGTTRAPLVGRAPERSLLWALMERAERGGGGIAFLHGEAGIGKTRLLEELAKMASFRGVRVVRAWSDNRERPAWGALRQLLGGAVTGVGRERAARALGSEWNEVLRPFLDGCRVKSDRGVGAIAVDAILAASQARPHLLVWEDLHDADVESVSWLTQLAPHTRTAPVLLAASLRRVEARQNHPLWELIEGLSSAPTVHLVAVEPLCPEESLELALALAHGDAQRASACALASEGNPLLLCELVRETKSGREVATSAPECLVAVLRRRLDSLRSPARRVLEILSLLGGPAGLDVLGLIAGLGRDETLRAIEELLTTELLMEGRHGVKCTHRWIADSVLSLLEPPRTARLARRCAQVLIAHGGSSDQVAALLLAGDRRRAAVPFLLEAGRHALESDAPATAAEHLTRALDLGRAVTGRRTFHLLEARAAARHRLGERRGEATDTRSMLTLANRAQEPALLATAMLSRATYYHKSGRTQEGERLAARALSWARKASDPRLEARVLCRAAEFDLHFGRLRSAGAKFGTVLRMRSVGLGPAEIGGALEGAGEACLHRGNFEQARSLFEEGLAIASRHGLADLRASCTSALGAAHNALGDDWQALQLFREAARIWRERQHRRREAVALTNVALMLGKLGRHREGLEALATALSLKQQIGDADSLAVTILHEGTLRQDAGEPVPALRCFRTALSGFKRTRNRGWFAEAEGKVGGALCAVGRPGEGLVYLQSSLERRRQLGDRYTLPGLLSQLAVCEGRLGRRREALAHSRQAVRSVGRSGAAGFAPLVFLNHYRVLDALGRDDTAEAGRAVQHGVQAVLAQAAQISDKAYRRSFLQQNAEARAIREAHRRTRRALRGGSAPASGRLPRTVRGR
jgi:DNA-binding SARP family transcriptional activator/tetratricopeptide (TPR) repeat protein